MSQDLRGEIFYRVHFSHAGPDYRFVLYRYDLATIAIWLETRVIGIFGRFDVVRALSHEEASAAPDSEEEDGDDGDGDGGDDDDGERFFISKYSYVSGRQVRNEMARL